MGRPDEISVTRREFFSYVFMGSSLLASLTLMATYATKFLFPSAGEVPKRKLSVTTVDNLPPGKSIKFKDLRGQEITVKNTGAKFTVLSTKCTHLGCQVHLKEKELQLYCPCHEGYIDADGNVIKSPPSVPLQSYKIEFIDQAIYIHVDEVFSART